MSNKFISARSAELLRQLRGAKMGDEPETVLLRANQWIDYIDYVNRRGAQPGELATLRAENARLRAMLKRVTAFIPLGGAKCTELFREATDLLAGKDHGNG